MKNAMTLVIMIIIMVLSFNMIDAQDEKKDRLTPITESIGDYKDKSLTLILRLKDVDYTMEKITFYDIENIDITFDIVRYQKNKKLSKSLQIVHPGIRYRVTFTVAGVDPSGLVSGQLVSFEPVFIDKIP